MKRFALFGLVLVGILALTPLAAWGPAGVALADMPPGTTPPTVDGLLDSSYVYDGGTSAPDTPGKLYHFFSESTCYYALVVDRSFNDNVFGPYPDTVLDGWGQHKFKHLETSDAALFEGVVPGCSFNLDYLDRSGSPSQWCSGTCGDAFAMTPAGCTEIEAATSMYYNATQSLYGLANFNPAVTRTDQWNSPPLMYSGDGSGDYYEWNMIYEFSVPMPAGGCGTVEVASSHHSPSKADQHTPGLARLGNFVWLDDSRDGIQNEGGGGMGGVCMHLMQAGADGLMGTADDVKRATTHTDREGEYWFSYLLPGTYYVDPDPACISDVYCHTINLDEVPNDNGSMTDPPGTDPVLCEEYGPGSGDAFPITIAAGATYPKADFGYDFGVPTAVELLSFRARARTPNVIVRWQTASETDNLGFNVYRAVSAKGPKVKINQELIPSLVPPGSPFGATYTYRDTTAQPGVLFYWLEDVDIYGMSGLHGPIKVRLEAP